MSCIVHDLQEQLCVLEDADEGVLSGGVRGRAMPVNERVSWLQRHGTLLQPSAPLQVVAVSLNVSEDGHVHPVLKVMSPVQAGLDSLSMQLQDLLQDDQAAVSHAKTSHPARVATGSVAAASPLNDFNTHSQLGQGQYCGGIGAAAGFAFATEVCLRLPL